MRKLFIVIGATCLLAVGAGIGASCGTAGAGEGGAAACSCPSAEVVKVTCVADKASHAYPGKKAADLLGASVFLTGQNDQPATISGGVPFVVADGLVSAPCSGATGAIFVMR